MAEMMPARTAYGRFIVGGIDILAGLTNSNSIISFSWQDNTNDMADGITVEIADPTRSWMMTYLPAKGVEAQATITVDNWAGPGDTRIIDCGIFWIDQIDLSGPPNVVSIKGTSIPVSTGIKTQRKFMAWEGVDIMLIAAEIAAKNGLALMWDCTKIPPPKERIDQSEAPDLEFIKDKIKEASLSLKLFKRQLVIYSEAEYDARPPVYQLIYGASHILNYSISSKLDDTYKGASNSFVETKSGELKEIEFTPGLIPEGTGSELKSNEIEEEEPDIAKIQSKLREKNKREKTASFTIVGDPGFFSGLNAQLVGFGAYDGKWAIEGTTHDISSSGYITTLTLRTCLDY